jgi:hypothetical protein
MRLVSSPQLAARIFQMHFYSVLFDAEKCGCFPALISESNQSEYFDLTLCQLSRERRCHAASLDQPDPHARCNRTFVGADDINVNRRGTKRSVPEPALQKGQRDFRLDRVDAKAVP